MSGSTSANENYLTTLMERMTNHMLMMMMMMMIMIMEVMLKWRFFSNLKLA